MQLVIRDLPQAVRHLLRAPWFSAVVILLLATGIGANVLIFTAVDVLLLRPLPVSEPEHLVRLGIQRSPAHLLYGHAYVYARVLRERTHSFSEVFTSWPMELGFAAGPTIEKLNGNVVSGNYFLSLGLSPAAGRLFTEEDEQRGAALVVLSDGFWKRAFAARRDVIGATVHLRGAPFTVIGVLRPEFVDLVLDNRPDVWVTTAAWKLWTPKTGLNQTPADVYLRLRKGVSLAQAGEEVRAQYPAMVDAEFTGQSEFGPEFVKQSKLLKPVLTGAGRGVSTLRKQFADAVTGLMGGVAALLLLVCGNVSGLLLARAEFRRRDVVIRLSLGASRWSIARSALAEAILLAGVGGVAGLAIARWSGRWLLAFLPSRQPLGIELTPDASVIAFALAVCVLSALLSSLLPAWSLCRSDVSGLLAQQINRTTAPRFGRGLVILQVAIATLLVAGGLTLVRTLDTIRSQAPGFRRERLIVMTLDPTIAGVESGDAGPLINEVVRRARQLPGVESVSLAQRPLMRGIGFKANAGRAGSRINFADALNVSLNGIGIGHFANMGMRIVEGRGFDAADAKTKPRPVVVSQSFARQFFSGIDPIGQWLGTAAIGSVAQPDMQIVGVVNDSKYRSMREVPPPTIYSLLDPENPKYESATLHLGFRGNASSIVAGLSEVLKTVGPGLAATDVATMEQEIDTSLWQERLLAALSSVFAAVSAVLAAIGLFGMLAFAVSRRTREIGIRMAVGATAARVAAMIARDAAWTIFPGALLGLASYAILSRAIESLLYGVTRHDPASLAGAAACVLMAGVAATCIPVLRAVRIQPADALRAE